MGLRLVRFSLAGTGCASSIEISQAGIAQAVNLMEPCQHSLYQQLRFAVRIGRMDGIVLLNRSALGIAEQRSRRRENETRYSSGQHRFEQCQCIRGVVAEEFFGSLHRLAGFDQRGKMHDALNPAGPKYLVKASAVRQIAYYQFSLFRHSLTMAATQVIEDDDIVSGLQ